MYGKCSSVVLTVVITGLVAGAPVQGGKGDLAPTSISGAIYTTDATGGLVNGNIYTQKEDVYLNGGPGVHAPSYVTPFPDGRYYFQVTDPSGRTLLSLSPPRSATIAGGVFELVQLAPFADTPNEDGVYKVWLTPVACYIGNTDDPGPNFGFVEKYSKTDNFRVVRVLKPQHLRVRKFQDCNANGLWDPDEKELKGWEIHLIEPGGTATQVKGTPVDIPAYNGDWRVLEFLRSQDCPDWVQTALIVDGVAQPVDTSTTVKFVGSYDAEENHEVIFGNTPLGSITACKFYDYNANGLWDNCEPPIPGIQFVLMGCDIFGDPAEPPNVTRTLYTGAGGCVTFCGLYPGVYTLTEVAPANTPACNWQPTTPIRIENVVVTCDGPQGTVHQFGNIITAVADFTSTAYWHKNGIAGIARCLEDSDADADPREQLSLQLLEFVFNVWQHLGGPTTVEMPDGSWASTDGVIAAAVAAANRTEPDAREVQEALISLLDKLNKSSAVVYVVQDFSGCVPAEEY